MRGHYGGSWLVSSWLAIPFIIIVLFSICASPSLSGSSNVHATESKNDESRSLRSEMVLGGVVKSYSNLLLTKLPKGPVIPSGPSPNRNSIHTDSFAEQP